MRVGEPVVPLHTHEWDKKIAESEKTVIEKARDSGNPVEYLIKENEILKGRLKETETSYANLLNKNISLRQENKQLNTKLSQGMSNVAKVKKVEINLKASRKDSNKEITELKNIHLREISNLKSEINELTSDNIKLTEKISKLSKQLFAANNDRSSQAKSMKSLREKIEELEVTNRKIKIEHAIEISDLTEEMRTEQK